jgi:hypothetical protein
LTTTNHPIQYREERRHDDMSVSNPTLVNVLREALQREYQKIDSAEKEIIKLKLELLELGVELPLHE